MKNYILLIAVTILVTNLSVAQTVSLKKQYYAPGEIMIVKFTAPASYPESAWVGIVPSSIAHGEEELCDKHDLAFEHLKERTNGEINFITPSKTGTFDVRMFDKDLGKEVASQSFTIVAPNTQIAINKNEDKSIPKGTSLLEVETTTLTQGERFSVKYVAPPFKSSAAWIGMYEPGPTGVRINFQIIATNESGTVFFYAPKKAGNYELKMFGDEKETNPTTQISITVK